MSVSVSEYAFIGISDSGTCADKPANFPLPVAKERRAVRPDDGKGEIRRSDYACGELNLRTLLCFAKTRMAMANKSSLRMS